jgi:CRP/FNR family transcriptional regulator, cyclic AMP receptor protein
MNRASARRRRSAASDLPTNVPGETIAGHVRARRISNRHMSQCDHRDRGDNGVMRRWEILEPLDDAQRRAVLQTAVRRRYRNGDTLFHQGDPGDSFHMLDKGHVAVRIVSPRGETITLDILEPGDSFGEQSIIWTEARRTASIVAIGTVETLMLHRNDFVELQHKFPETSRVLVGLLAVQVRRLSEQVMDAHTMSADARILKQLHRLAAGFGEGGAAVIPITQEELASLAGTTRPTANRALQTLVADDVIRLHRGRIEIPDIGRLPA